MRKYLNLKKKKTTTKKGFSFAEVILSVFVLSTGLLSVLGLMTSNLRHSTESRKTIIATGLAQEGVELVRNKMDNNIAAGNPQFDGFVNSNNQCIGLSSSGISTACNAGGGYVLYYRLAGQLFYTHEANASAEQTAFKRVINISVSGTNNRLVRSLVWWGTGAAPAVTSCNAANKCVYAETLLVEE